MDKEQIVTAIALLLIVIAISSLISYSIGFGKGEWKQMVYGFCDSTHKGLWAIDFDNASLSFDRCKREGKEFWNDWNQPETPDSLKYHQWRKRYIQNQEVSQIPPTG